MAKIYRNVHGSERKSLQNNPFPSIDEDRVIQPNYSQTDRDMFDDNSRPRMLDTMLNVHNVEHIRLRYQDFVDHCTIV